MPRPKLSLRDFFWLAAFVALAMGWYCDRRALRRELERQGEDLQQARALWIDAQVNNAWRQDLTIPRTSSEGATVELMWPEK